MFLYTHHGYQPPFADRAINRRLLDGNSRSFAGLVDTAKEGIVDSHVLLQMS